MRCSRIVIASKYHPYGKEIVSRSQPLFSLARGPQEKRGWLRETRKEKVLASVWLRRRKLSIDMQPRFKHWLLQFYKPPLCKIQNIASRNDDCNICINAAVSYSHYPIQRSVFFNRNKNKFHNKLTHHIIWIQWHQIVKIRQGCVML